MTALMHCRRCAQPIRADAFGYLRCRTSGHCDRCFKHKTGKPTYVEQVTARPLSKRDHTRRKHDYSDASWLLLEPYMADLTDLFDSDQNARLRHALVDEQLDLLGTDYVSRIYNLEIMGFSDYHEYLRSDLYAAIRTTVMTEKWECCVACGWIDFYGNAIHHCRYSLLELMGLNLDYLLPVCRRCHHHIELHITGKRKLRMANQHLKFLIVSRDRPMPACLTN